MLLSHFLNETIRSIRYSRIDSEKDEINVIM